MKFKNFFQALPLLLFTTSSWSQTTLTCDWQNNQCGGNSGYSGPWGRVGPRRGDASYDAYRYGKVREYEAYKARLDAMIAEQRERMRELDRGEADLAMAREQIHEAEEKLKHTEHIPDEGIRRRLNPVPTGSSEAKLTQMVDPLWKDVRENNMFAMQKDMDILIVRMTMAKEADRIFVLKDLSLSGLASSDGILKLPNARMPWQRFEEPMQSPFGRDLRNQVNRALVSQSVLGAACAKTPQAENGCAQWQDQLNEAVDGIYILDRLVARDGGILNPFTQRLYDELRFTIELGYGFAKGVAEGGIALVEGTYELLTSPIQTIHAMASAVLNYRELIPILKDGAQKLYQELQTADAERRGEILGRAAFEITTTLMPVGQAIAGSRLGVLAHAASYEAIAQLAETTRLGTLVKPFEVRASFAAKHLGITGAKQTEFLEWAAKYLDQADNGNLLITFAKRMSPERYEALIDVQKKLGTSVSEQVHEYLVKLVLYEKTIINSTFSAEEMEQIAQLADHIDRALKGVKGVPAPPEGIPVTRSTPASYTDKFKRPGQNSSETILEINEGGLYASHRYSGPGEGALYTVEGVGEDARQLSLEEIGWDEKKITLTTSTVAHPKNILIIEPDFLRSLNISIDDVIGKDYRVTQILGYFGKRHGFDAIRAPSAVDKVKNNLILFESIR